jgi:hypothetical protein
MRSGRVARSIAPLACLICALAVHVAGSTASTTGEATISEPTVPGCSWPAEGNAEVFNVAFPDQSATYWLAALPAAANVLRVRIEGEYPYARYFSFHVYNATEEPVDHLPDFQINPEPGSRNPFRRERSTSTERHYTAFVDFAERPSAPAPNTMYTGTTNPLGAIMYRVYVPNDAASAAGSVPLPTLELERADGSSEVLTLGQCEPLAPTAGGTIQKQIEESSYPPGATGEVPFPLTSDPPAFSRAGPLGGGRVPSLPLGTSSTSFFSNLDNAYLKAALSRQFGQVLAMRMRVPTFPNTRAGVPVTRRRNMRYWSVCMNEFLTQRYVACLADYQTIVKRGIARYVIADPGERPANANAAHGINFLPWPGVFYDGLVIYRNMLPSPEFMQSVFALKPNEALTGQMGEYGPVARYCSRATIEAKGVDGCLAG